MRGGHIRGGAKASDESEAGVKDRRNEQIGRMQGKRRDQGQERRGGGRRVNIGWEEQEEDEEVVVGRRRVVARSKKGGEIGLFGAEKYFRGREEDEAEEEEEEEGEAGGDLPLSPLVEIAHKKVAGRRGAAPMGGREIESPPKASVLEAAPTPPPAKGRTRQPASPSNRLASFLARFKIPSISETKTAAPRRKSPGSPILHLVAPRNSDTPAPLATTSPGKGFFTKPPSPRSLGRFLRALSSSSSTAVPAASASSPASTTRSAPDHSPLRLRPANYSPPGSRTPDLISHPFCSTFSRNIDRCCPPSDSSRDATALLSPSDSPRDATHESALDDRKLPTNKTRPGRSTASVTSNGFRLPFLSRKLKVNLVDSREVAEQEKAVDQQQRMRVPNGTLSGPLASDYDHALGNQDLYRHHHQDQQRRVELPVETRQTRMGEVAKMIEARERRRRTTVEEEEHDDELAERLLRVVQDHQQAVSSRKIHSQHHDNFYQPQPRISSRYIMNPENGYRNNHYMQSGGAMEAPKLQNSPLNMTTSPLRTKHISTEIASRKEDAAYDSDSSSDLFEIETLGAAAGKGYYRRDLPVYKTKDPANFGQFC